MHTCLRGEGTYYNTNSVNEFKLEKFKLRRSNRNNDNHREGVDNRYLRRQICLLTIYSKPPQCNPVVVGYCCTAPPM